MEDKNRYSGLIEGLTKGLYGIGQGLIEKSYRNDAKSEYEKSNKFLQDSYTKGKTLSAQMLKEASTPQQGGGTTPETPTTDETPTTPPYVQPVINHKDVGNATPDPTGAYNQLFTDRISKLNDSILKLKQNPFGKDYAESLENTYKSLFPKHEYKTVFDKESNMMVTFDEYGNIVRKQKYLDEPPKTLPKKYTQEEIDKMTLADVEKMNTDDIDKIFNFLPISVQNEWSAKHTQPEETTGFKGSSRRSGFRGSGTTPLSNIRQSNYDSDLKGYNKAVEENDQETMNFYKNKFLEKGLDINQKYEEYKNLDPKKKRQFLADTERQEQQINTSYNEVYQHLNMDNWWKDLDSSIDVNDLSNKVAYYEDYLNKEVFPNVPKEIGAKLWSELQKAKAKIYNYKGFANQ